MGPVAGELRDLGLVHLACLLVLLELHLGQLAGLLHLRHHDLQGCCCCGRACVGVSEHSFRLSWPDGLSGAERGPCGEGWCSRCTCVHVDSNAHTSSPRDTWSKPAKWPLELQPGRRPWPSCLCRRKVRTGAYLLAKMMLPWLRLMRAARLMGSPASRQRWMGALSSRFLSWLGQSECTARRSQCSTGRTSGTA